MFPDTPTPQDAIKIVEPDPDAEIELDLSAILTTPRPEDDGLKWVTI